jgi:hypothetical protein
MLCLTTFDTVYRCSCIVFIVVRYWVWRPQLLMFVLLRPRTLIRISLPGKPAFPSSLEQFLTADYLMVYIKRRDHMKFC